jgi:ribosomal protein S12 methylthiotransferase
MKFSSWNWKDGQVRAHMTDLARELGKLGGPDNRPWVRLHYVYPYPHVDDVIPLMAEGLVLPYLDIPFQHASPKVLKAMRRPANEAKVLERLKKWRSIVPDIAVRSSFVGFPGETEEDFQYLLDWLQEARLDRVGAFRFEPVEGAAANALPDHVPEGLKEERYQRVMELTARISAEKLAAKVGKHIDVLIDRVDESPSPRGGEGDSAERSGVRAHFDGHLDAPHPEHHHAIGATGRSKADAPEIDGEVHLRDAGGLKQGDIVKVLVEDSDEHDLYGVPL